MNVRCVIKNYQATLFEAYRIGELIVNRIASYQNGNYYSANNVNSFIWDRRKDLHGLELQIICVESLPFISYVNDVSLIAFVICSYELSFKLIHTVSFYIHKSS